MKIKLWLSNVEDHLAFRNIKLSICSAKWTDFINIGFSENVRNRTSFIVHFMTIKSIYIESISVGQGMGFLLGVIKMFWK